MTPQKKIIIYLHGFRSNENGSKVGHIKNFFPECEVFGLKYEPHKPVDAAKAIKDIVEKIGAKNIKGFVGTSLGGFWARWAAVKHDLITVAINPSLAPYKTLKTGIYSKFDNDPSNEVNIEVTQEDLKAYPKYSVSIEEVNTSVLHIFALDDEILDSNVSLKLVGNRYPCAIFKTGGHRFENFERLEKSIKHRFYSTQK
ncbi:YqiA/YcfP family alpha/beta fold hydrolase [Marinicellulosiphila megalodicopiae]|uniref:YqiA/YcfP family alpha/beta fold hydrolase n=1 Tax=Marinicellulosiphila megalodicopiae TaxID=2724896 RepID=UPI003BAFC50B